MSEPRTSEPLLFSPGRSLLIGAFLLLLASFLGAGIVQGLAGWWLGDRAAIVLSGVGLESDSEVNAFRLFAALGNVFTWGFAGLAWAALNGRVVSTLRLNVKPNWVSLALCAFAMVLALPVMQSLVLTPEVFSLGGMSGMEEWMEQQESSRVEAIKTLIGSPEVGVFLLNLITIALIPAFAEEVFFRGGLQRTLDRMMNPHLSVWLAAFLFAALHFQFLGMLPRILLGAVLGYSFQRTGSLWVSISAHFLFNGMNLLLGLLAVRGVLPADVVEPDFRFPVWMVALSAALALCVLWLGLRKPRSGA